MSDGTRVVVVRGHQLTSWELGPWERLPGQFTVACLETAANRFDAGSLRLGRVPIRSRRDALPRAPIFDLAFGLVRDRYVGLASALAGADIVHAEELAYWFSADVAEYRQRLGYRLVQTVWETIPLLEAYRSKRARENRRRVLKATDLFLPATERARDALLLEGVAAERIRVCPPGVDVERFASATAPDPPPREHLILSPGRLVWEKGHQDVLRAVAALHRGLVPSPARTPPRLLFVGGGPEEERLRAHAAELGIGAAVDFASVSYERMPELYARSSAVVLASLPHSGCELPPMSGRFRCFWEEQFGMVLAEALAAGRPIFAASSGAIPEVTRGSAGLFAPGDWLELARLLADGPLARPPGTKVAHPPELVRHYSTEMAAERLAAAYADLV